MGLFSECFDSIVIKLTYGDKLMTVVLTEMLIYHISVTIFLLDFLNTSRYTPQKSFNLSEDLDTARVLKPKQVVVFFGVGAVIPGAFDCTRAFMGQIYLRSI